MTSLCEYYSRPHHQRRQEKLIAVTGGWAADCPPTEGRIRKYCSVTRAASFPMRYLVSLIFGCMALDKLCGLSVGYGTPVPDRRYPKDRIQRSCRSAE